MEHYFVITNTNRDNLIQWISEISGHRSFQEVSNVLKMLAGLSEAELPKEPSSEAAPQ